MVKCYACGRFIGSTEGAACSTCTLVYHLGCIGKNKTGKIPKNWSCPECLKNKPRDNGTDTPVKSALETQATAPETCSTSEEDTSGMTQGAVLNTPTLTNKESDITLASEIRLFREQMKSLHEEVSLMRHDIHELRKDIASNNLRIDALENRVGVLEQNMSQKQDSADQFESIISQLKIDLNDRDQELLANDLEITNVPESNSENPVHLVTLVGTKLGLNIDSCDIVYAERVGAARSSQNGNAGERGVGRPRPLIVRFARRIHRDDLMKNMRVRRNANTADFGLASESVPFYINERLTKYNRQLLFKVREARKQMEWKFVWTKRGRIFVKQGEGKKAHVIRTERDITRVFGAHPVKASRTTDLNDTASDSASSPTSTH